jgi:hypothetical protein
MFKVQRDGAIYKFQHHDRVKYILPHRYRVKMNWSHRIIVDFLKVQIVRDQNHDSPNPNFGFWKKKKHALISLEIIFGVN